MSSGSESDEEYVPEEPEQLSEEDSADEETEKQYSEELEHKTKKRKAAQDSKAKKKRRNIKQAEEMAEPISEESEQNLDPEEEKKREEDLWAKFLEGTDTIPKPSVKESNDINKRCDDQRQHMDKLDKKEDKKSDDAKEKERRIFEFAGETIVVENNVIKEKIKTADAPASVTKTIEGPSSRRGGGLSSVLGQINKKNKLSTLEKSKLDWETYKKEEGIEDEIQNHNKGKGGYLDRKDFLERADLRQYEIERDLRMSRRSNR